MCTVGDDALHKAGEGVQYAGHLAAVELEMMTNVARDGSRCDDGDGVVCGAEVSYAHQGGDAQFRSSLSFDVISDVVEDEVNAAVVAYQFEHTSRQEGDNDELAHADDAFTHGSEPIEE